MTTEEQTSENKPGEKEISEVGVIARYEAERRKKVAIGLVAVLVLVGGAVAGIMAMGDKAKLKLDVQQAEQDAIQDSNDPQCRGLIADVTDFGKRYKSEHAEALEAVTSKDRATVEASRAKIKSLRGELEKMRIASLAAELRYEDSREDLKKWFKHVDTEFRLLDLRAEEQLKRIDAEAKGEEYVPIKKKNPRKGKIVGAKEETDTRTPEEKRDAAILTIHDAFENFRVWHSGSSHPCGAAAKDEKPWTGDGAPAAPATPDKSATPEAG